MADQLENAAEFAQTLAEVDLLLHEADAAAPGQPNASEEKVSVMNKAALLLLTGKFETFLEGAAEDFLSAVNSIGAKAHHIPMRILAEDSVRAVSIVKSKLDNGDITSLRDIFLALARRWTQIDVCSELNVSCSFNYGTHGEKEIVRLFKRIGIDNVFESVTISDGTDEVYEGANVANLDVKGIINSLTGIRNSILHQDQSPTLTTSDLRKHGAALLRFADAVVGTLQAVIDTVEANSQNEAHIFE